MKTLNEIVDNFRTSCCNEEVIHKARAKYTCKKCGEDVSLEFYCYMNMFLENGETHQNLL